jgi:hypothetical protein
MPLTKEQQTAVLSAARALIGKKTYKDLDCSHFVHFAYAQANLHYPYKATADFDKSLKNHFKKVDLKKSAYEAADVLMFAGHMGLWDSDGCKVLQTEEKQNAECERFDNRLSFLSSRSGDNRGPDFGMTSWFGKLKAVYRWK